MSRLDQIRRMSDDDLILFLRRYKSEKSSCNRCAKKDTIGGNMKEKTKAFYKAVFKYWLHERKESVKRLFVRRTK